MKKTVQLASSTVLPIIIVLARPLGTSLQQAVILASLLLTITWWCTKLVERTLASVFLLAMFCLFGNTPIKTIFSFPLSENFILIVLSFLFSEGISNSGLPDRLLLPLLGKRANTSGRIIFSMLILVFVMIFIIPQPFSRIIVLSLIYHQFFERAGVRGDAQQTLLFGLYAFSTLINMLFIRGDIILNNAAVGMSGLTMGEGEWMLYMTLPTLVLCALSVILYRVIFAKELSGIQINTEGFQDNSPISHRQKRDLIFILAVVILWATESLHGISGLYIVTIGTLLMFPLRLLRLPDFRSVNIKLLIFLTAAFSIGGVMKVSGSAELIFSRFTPLFPSSFGFGYAALIVLVAMVLHMVLGSNITTLSVIVPGILSIGEGMAAPQVLLFLIFIAVCGHYLLPFHHVIILLGEGKSYYGGNHILRFGAAMTIILFAVAMFVYLAYWKLAGLI